MDDGQIVGAMLTDLSKAFDCINHDLIIETLAVYHFSYESLEFIESYLTDWKQRIRINHTYSFYSAVTYGVTQGSIYSVLGLNVSFE